MHVARSFESLGRALVGRADSAIERPLMHTRHLIEVKLVELIAISKNALSDECNVFTHLVRQTTIFRFVQSLNCIKPLKRLREPLRVPVLNRRFRIFDAVQNGRSETSPYLGHTLVEQNDRSQTDFIFFIFSNGRILISRSAQKAGFRLWTAGAEG